MCGLSVQRQTADGHDQETAEGHQATVRIAPATFPGTNHLLPPFPLSYPFDGVV